LELSRALDALPPTLDDTYARMLQSIPQEQRYDSVRLLQLLVYSNRPLSLAEAVDALAVDLTTKPYFDPSNRTPIPSEIIVSCSSLVTIERIKVIHHPSQEVLQLAHFSVQQYLKSEKVHPDWKHCMSEQYAMASNAKVCLAYCFQVQPFNFGYDHRIERPFTNTAATQWTEYAMPVEAQDTELYAMIQDFLLSKELNQARFNWLVVRSRQEPSFLDQDWAAEENLPRPEDLVPLVIASLYGLFHTVRSLLLCGADPNKVCTGLGSALYGALHNLHYDVVELLLDYGARPNMTSGRAELSVAISYCSPTKLPELFHALLQHGADVNARDYRCGIPLVEAAELGYENIVSTLLARGADANAVYRKQNAIWIAAAKGNNKIVRKLLEYKADVNLKGLCGSALFSACDGIHKEVVQTLLENGAIVCQQSDDSLYRNALEVACCGPDEEIFELLIEYAARSENFEKRESLGGCLSLACSGGHEKIVRLLLGHKANVNAQHDGVGTPLVAACIGGHEQIVQLLLYHGTDVNQASAVSPKTILGHLCRGTPLLHLINEASKRNFFGDYFPLLVPAWIRILKILIAAGANVNTSDDHGQTPLHFAAISNSTEFSKILIEAGAIVDELDKHRRTPLLQVAGYCFLGFDVATIKPERHAKLLLDAGAKTDIQDIDGRTALHYAAMNGWLDFCRVLVEAGAHTGLQDIHSKTALHFAASSGYSEICTMLVKAGADFNLLDSEGCTPLQLAEQGSHFETVAFFRRSLQRKSLE